MQDAPQPARFGTFTGVFTPTLLTILGVIMYVRIGWLVGNAGLLGAWAIMAVGLIITVATGLSLSSIATNTRLGAGGPYAIVKRSLGLEVAGSIGIPLYLTRPLGVAMYIFGFREGIQWFLPSAPSLVVDLGVFGLLFGLAFVSADLAFKVQYGILALIAASLGSIFLGEATFEPVAKTTWVGDFPGFPEKGFGGTDFWGVFAVFFPATTGILAGANMSGELKDSRRSIARGTLAAIGLSTLIYFAVAWWASRAGTMEELASDYNLLIDRSAAPALVFLGLLGATASSALAGLVGGPRILMAMGQNRLLPFSDWLARTTPNGEPRNAALVTGALTLLCLAPRDLNAVAPLVTMFFLITYCIINVVVLFEQGLGLVSFRPTLRVPLVVPLVGTVGSIFAMFVVNPTFGLIAVALVVAVYFWIDRFVRIEEHSSQEARSSVFVALAEFAAHKASEAPHQSVRAWKPNLLVPVEDPAEVRGAFDLVCDGILPEGSARLLGIATPQTADALSEAIEDIDTAFEERGVPTSWTTLDCADYRTGVSAGLQALQAAFFRPNLLFLTTPPPDRDDDTAALVQLAHRTGVGTFLVARHPVVGIGQRRAITVWVAGGDGDVSEDFHGRNLNLALLMGYRIAERWGARLRLVTVVERDEDVDGAARFLRELVDLARLPSKTERQVDVGTFMEALGSGGTADLQILGLQPVPDFTFVRDVVDTAGCTCLFVRDSGRESVLA